VIGIHTGGTCEEEENEEGTTNTYTHGGAGGSMTSIWRAWFWALNVLLYYIYIYIFHIHK